MRYCCRCLYPENHPLMLAIGDDGVCMGCRVHEEKDSLDWAARELELRAILDEYRATSSTQYDCIVPVSGARDSFYVLHLVRKVYGLNPLLVSYNRHYNSHAGTANIERLRTELASDIVTLSLDPRLVRRVTLETLERRGSIHWHSLAGSTVFPVQTAVRLKIPLIIWGHQQGLDQVGMFSHTDEVEMTRRYRREHDLMGLEAEDMAAGASHATEADLAPFFYPSDADLARVGVRGIYLGNYIRWDTKAQHERMLPLYDYYTGPLPGTFDTYSDVDCRHYSGLHDHVKFLKVGYGKVTDHACREIRFGRLTREQGIALVAHHAHAGVPADAEDFARWLGVSVADILACVDRHRDPRAWEKASDGWRLRDSVLAHRDDPGVAAARLPLSPDMDFRVNRPAGLRTEPDAPQLLPRGYGPGYGS